MKEEKYQLGQCVAEKEISANAADMPTQAKSTCRRQAALIAPYYQDLAVTIYHGDCRSVMPRIADADLVLADPPYGMNYRSNHRAERFSFIEGDDSFSIEWLST